MTIANQAATAYYTGDGVTTQFPIPFKFNDPSHLTVSLVTISTKAAAVLSASQYTVTGAGNANGGAVTYTPAIASTQKIVITRNMPITQDLDLEREGGLFVEDIEVQLDNIVMMVQQVRAELANAAGSGQITSITQNVMGPLSSVTDRIATYADSVGNRIKDGGLLLSDLSPATHVHPENSIGVAKSADLLLTSTITLASDSELQFAMAANTVYAINAKLYVNAPSTSGIKIGITGPALPSNIFMTAHAVDETGTITGQGAASYTTVFAQTPGTTRRYVIEVRGRIANGSTPGTFALQFAQNVSNAASSTLMKGSILQYKAS